MDIYNFIKIITAQTPNHALILLGYVRKSFYGFYVKVYLLEKN